ncbi:MAG: hypothetical protein HY275_00170 [Gemmatimonadetes bacterium]|nr:hypothetical protein [Gemmatimonadota bacterium]
MAPSPGQVLTLVRIALLSGVLVFGGVAYAVRQGGTVPSITHEQAQTLRVTGMVIWGLALAALVTMRLALAERIARGRDTKLPLVAWAIGEMPALFGGVFFLLVGDWTIYVAGVVGLLASYALFPVPSRG